MKKDYIEFDDFGVKEIRCMTCGVMIGKRSYAEVESREEPGKMVPVPMFKHFNSMQRVPIEMENGRTIGAFVCSECKKGDLDLKEIEKQVHKGFELGAIHSGKTKEHVKKIVDSMKMKKRKAA